MTSGKIKVLLVDDEAQFRATTAKILNRRGFETMLAESGQQALEKIELAPDVVILDIKMPGMDGLEALRGIRERSPQTPVVMLTGHGSEGAAQEALQEGAFDFLNKPCDIELLAHKIHEAFLHGGGELQEWEGSVKDVMIPVEDYTKISQGATVAEAIAKLRQSFTAQAATDSIMETGHRSILVLDQRGDVQGILSIQDLLKALMPAYLSAPKPSTADAIQYSPMFWTGMFSKAVKMLAPENISQIMSPAPESIAADASLLEAAYEIVRSGHRRLCVVENDNVIGILREQDLFFEIDRILRK